MQSCNLGVVVLKNRSSNYWQELYRWLLLCFYWWENGRLINHNLWSTKSIFYKMSIRMVVESRIHVFVKNRFPLNMCLCSWISWKKSIKKFRENKISWKTFYEKKSWKEFHREQIPFPCKKYFMEFLGKKFQEKIMLKNQLFPWKPDFQKHMNSPKDSQI